MTKLPPFNSYWVIPDQFMAGEYPGHQFSENQTPPRLDALLEAGITTFIDLTEPHERVPYEPTLRERAGYYQIEISYQRFSIGDFGIPSAKKMRTILNTLHNALLNGEKPYVHCWAGMGRTGTTIGCFFVEQGMTGINALGAVQTLCTYGRSPQTEAQKNFVREWGQ